MGIVFSNQVLLNVIEIVAISTLIGRKNIVMYSLLTTTLLFVVCFVKNVFYRYILLQLPRIIFSIWYYRIRYYRNYYKSCSLTELESG